MKKFVILSGFICAVSHFSPVVSSVCAKDPLPKCFDLSDLNNENIVFKVCAIVQGLSAVESFKNPEQESKEANLLEFIYREVLTMFSTGIRTDKFDTVVNRLVSTVFEREGLEKFTDQVEKIDGVGERHSTKAEYELAKNTIELISRSRVVDENCLQSFSEEGDDSEGVKNNKAFVKKIFKDANEETDDMRKQQEEELKEAEFQKFIKDNKENITNAFAKTNLDDRKQDLDFLMSACPKNIHHKFQSYLEEEQDKKNKPKKQSKDFFDQLDLEVAAADVLANYSVYGSIQDYVGLNYEAYPEDIRNEIIAKAMSLE